jgi:8-oxo-dGTP diphosphatase
MTTIERFRPYVAVELLLIKDDQILLQRRFKTGYADGKYNPVSGHIDKDEFATEALIREAREEAGIDIDVKDLKLVHLQQFLPLDSGKEFVYFYFECKKWKGEPKIMEPEKHDDLSWFPLDALPENTIEYIRDAVECYKKNITYSQVKYSN